MGEPMTEHGAEFLASLYQPPLRRFPDPVNQPHDWAKAAAWGQALQDWLAGYETEKTRYVYLKAFKQLINFCQKLPWEVRQADLVEWLDVGLAGKASRTQYYKLVRVRGFYRFACGRTWRSPAGKQLRLCRANPVEGIALPALEDFKQIVALSEADLERLQAAFDLDTPYGRRDRALFTVMLETGLHLREAVRLRLKDLTPADGSEGAEGMEAPFPGQKAAWEAVRAYLEVDGRLAGMGPEDYVFTPLVDVTGTLAKMNPLDWDRQALGEIPASHSFKEYVRWAGLDPDVVKPEALRYSGAWRLMEAGASRQDVAAFLRIGDVWRAGQIMKHLQSSTKHRSRRRATAKTRRRRRRGAQPGNRNHLKHGKWSERYSLSRMGMAWGSVRNVTPEIAPWAFAALREMADELFALEPGTLDAESKRVMKLSHIAVTIGRVWAVWRRAQLEAKKKRRRPTYSLNKTPLDGH